MAFLCGLQFFWNGCSLRYEYSSVQKQDDDLGVAPAKEWLQSYTVEKVSRFWRKYDAEQFAERMFQSLKSIPISPLNQAMLQTRLVAICNLHPAIKQYILDHFWELNGDVASRSHIYTSIKESIDFANGN